MKMKPSPSVRAVRLNNENYVNLTDLTIWVREGCVEQSGTDDWKKGIKDTQDALIEAFLTWTDEMRK